MTVYVVDPLADSRWSDFVLQHPRASVFHTRPWLSALHAAYGYAPIAFSTSRPGEPLRHALVFCEVDSWLTGRRMVSLPFSDHCDLLADDPSACGALLARAVEHARRSRCKYAEIRPLLIADPDPFPGSYLRPSEHFHRHTLALDLPLERLFASLHKDCIQRKVRRAEREALRCEAGASDRLLRDFYELFVRTRRRHGLPPQPLAWFRRLVVLMGNQLTIHVASKHDRPVAAILMLSFKDTIVYKYSCSDERLNHLGGTPLLLWRIIEESKGKGMRHLDLGRTDVVNPGLAEFKDRLGAHRSDLRYYRVSLGRKRAESSYPRRAQYAKWLIGHLPDAILITAGRLIYRHIG